ncbi:MAG: YlxR family protein [Bacillota bacterium]|nr:YlxR family protein [Bacillota bacterium]
MARVRKLPQRTCIGCGEVEGKRQLLRVVRTPEGEIRFDPTGKRAGRGAYLHAEPACVERGLTPARLERALRLRPAPEALEALRRELGEVLAGRGAAP